MLYVRLHRFEVVGHEYSTMSCTVDVGCLTHSRDFKRSTGPGASIPLIASPTVGT